MFDDDDLPKPKNDPAPRNLTTLSIDELDAYVIWLRGEIERTEADKQRKQAATGAAAKLFKA